MGAPVRESWQRLSHPTLFFSSFFSVPDLTKKQSSGTREKWKEKKRKGGLATQPMSRGHSPFISPYNPQTVCQGKVKTYQRFLFLAHCCGGQFLISFSLESWPIIFLLSVRPGFIQRKENRNCCCARVPWFARRVAFKFLDWRIRAQQSLFFSLTFLWPAGMFKDWSGQ